MQTLRFFVASGLALALSAISIICCYVFGTHLAPGNEGVIYGVLGGTADALKAILPLAIAAALAARQRGRALAGAVLFAVFCCYSFASELGLYALSRDAQAGNGLASKAAYEQIKTDRKAIQDRLAALGQTRPARAVEADIAAQRQNRLWSMTAECKEATGAAARAFCAGLEKLAGELASAEEAEKLRADDAKLAQKLSGVDLAAVLKSADPQSEALSRFTGLAPSTVRDALAILVALLIESGSGFGLYAVTASGSRTDSKAGASHHGGRSERPPVGLPVGLSTHNGKRTLACSVPLAMKKERRPRDPVKIFLKESCTTRPGAEATAAELHRAFQSWAANQNREPLSPKALGTKLHKAGFARIKRGGVVRYAGLAVIP